MISVFTLLVTMELFKNYFTFIIYLLSRKASYTKLRPRLTFQLFFSMRVVVSLSMSCRSKTPSGYLVFGSKEHANVGYNSWLTLRRDTESSRSMTHSGAKKSRLKKADHMENQSRNFDILQKRKRIILRKLLRTT